VLSSTALLLRAAAQPHSCVAFLPCARLVLKALKPKEIAVEPECLGKHIKRRRLELRLSQRQVAAALGVDPITILNWEKRKTKPVIRLLPAIVAFIGYSPMARPAAVGERLLQFRKRRGWSIDEAAKHLGVDPRTWGHWERGKLILFQKHRMTVARLLGVDEDELSTGWNMTHPS
jgi:transcriptional regulator with XRE-family HTH domain